MENIIRKIENYRYLLSPLIIYILLGAVFAVIVGIFVIRLSKRKDKVTDEKPTKKSEIEMKEFKLSKEKRRRLEEDDE